MAICTGIIYLFFLRRAAGLLTVFLTLFSGTIHSVLSEVSRPPKPTMMKISGQRFQKAIGSNPKLEAMKINPITTNVSGQKTLLGIILSLFYLNVSGNYFDFLSNLQAGATQPHIKTEIS
jgi:hypothetical protein